MTALSAPACSQALPVKPQGSGSEVLKRERGHVTAETGVAEVAIFGALQPNAISTKLAEYMYLTLIEKSLQIEILQ